MNTQELMDSLHTLDQLYQQPERCAEKQNLIYLQDKVPGFQRKRWGRGFRYFAPTGEAVDVGPERERLKKIYAPPAWRNVWLAPQDNFHVLAYGEDAEGRTQYTYHPRWLSYRSRLKYYHLLAFAQALPGIRRFAYTQLRTFDPTQKQSVLALMSLLLDKGALRIGSELYYENSETVGLTTLQASHVHLDGAKIELCYPAKSNKERCIHLQNKRLAGYLSELKALRSENERLFQYRVEEEFSSLSSDQLNAHLKRFSDFAISAKDFRTWTGTLNAFRLMRNASLKDEKLPLSHITQQVAEILGNTPTIARNSYIHVDLIDLWQSGDFADFLAELPPPKRKHYFSKDEVQLTSLLDLLMQERLELVA